MVVVHTTAADVRVEVIDWVTGVKLTIRGPRPPVGLTTSVDWVKVRGLPPGSFQVIWKVVRRKSSPLESPTVPAAAGVHASAGGDAASLSAGSSKVHDVDESVKSTPRRSIVHGVPDPKPRACNRVFTSEPDMSAYDSPRTASMSSLVEVRGGDAGVVGGRRAQRPGEHRQHAEQPDDEHDAGDDALDDREAILG